MGITGLLPVLKSITETKSIQDYEGCTLAIDGYCWFVTNKVFLENFRLHRAIYSCSEEVCLGKETDKYVTYFMDRIAALQHNGVNPYVVFDGGSLPMKKGTDEERRKSRQKNRELGIQHYNKNNFSEARKSFVRAADVSPYMAHRVIQHLKARNVSYVVAPYEADAQLAYLVKKGLADGVITEDSDCLLFGCQVVLFKMDRDNVAQEIQLRNLKCNKGLNFHMFTEQMFLEMCIFSGCDYLPRIPGFGLKRAYTAMKQYGSAANIIRALRLEGKVHVPTTYESDFKKAVLTFRHQRVYCPREKVSELDFLARANTFKGKLVPLTPIPESLLETDRAMDFIGPLLHSDIATEIANGDMDPITMKRFSHKIQHSHPSSSSPCTFLVETNQTLLAASRKPKGYEVSVASVSNTSRLSTSAVKRKFPLSPMDKWIATASLPKKKMLHRGLATIPLYSSRAFGKKITMISPPNEYLRKTTHHSIGITSYESQESCKVDLVTNNCMDPKSDKVFITPEGDKENLSPNSPRAKQDASVPGKETAFSRMMRAGSMLQRQNLKKKTTSDSGFRKKKRCVTHEAPKIRHVLQLASLENIKPIADAPIEQSTYRSENSNEENDALILDKMICKETTSTRSQAPITSFDRFRFKP
ncbi:hypothetical protein PsorP6_000167 [Peronosclerospora sorghi]|uniref:Uncharacterized protein n=1 Tax=Peronosclerospora sorghi TaxID=230839 RepID=A0ACC0WXC0_9STRA|nr:hypothetical protein PsorP6_000167 [Peronosclerospora sorghi]